MQTLAESQFAAALRMAEDPAASPAERAEMLMEIAMGLQVKPRSPAQLHDAVALYERALAQAPADARVLQARIRCRMGTALQALPDGGADALKRARECFEAALPLLRQHGGPEEAAEAGMNLGLAIQGLAAGGLARMQDAIQCYQDALKVFRRELYPREFAILHNNLAIAYLSLPVADERGKVREALAVQSFEEVLKVITLVDHPAEYAMVQNNLGNALQYAASGHVFENNLRALAAYDEALKVRTRRAMPVEYANTLANKANVLGSLSQEAGGEARGEAAALYREAQALFEEYGLPDRARLVADALAELGADAHAPLPAQDRVES